MASLDRWMEPAPIEGAAVSAPWHPEQKTLEKLDCRATAGAGSVVAPSHPAENCNLHHTECRTAKSAGASPIETDFGERAAIIEFDGQIPREWAKGYARLQGLSRPSSIPENRWLQVIDDTGRFLDSWGAKLAAFGWTVPEVFGVHPKRPEVRRGGLVWHIRGCKVLAASADRVVIETRTGNKQSIYRRADAEHVVIWSLPQ